MNSVELGADALASCVERKEGSDWKPFRKRVVFPRFRAFRCFSRSFPCGARKGRSGLARHEASAAAPSATGGGEFNLESGAGAGLSRRCPRRVHSIGLFVTLVRRAGKCGVTFLGGLPAAGRTLPSGDGASASTGKKSQRPEKNKKEKITKTGSSTNTVQEGNESTKRPAKWGYKETRPRAENTRGTAACALDRPLREKNGGQKKGNKKK